ncbi:LysE family translocator [Paraglaciecola sp. 20A4]|uniref:LysE family translocator n=1 Tax=Paraglaciecola sp. 20A4 TaxID=2687288 RepID=UPI001408F364|nr:LysE family translocator [Paraglaciecola sp. 20A4]
MPSLDILLSFSIAALLLSLSPGPSNLYIMARSINQGHQAGIAAAGGMAVGSFVYVLATAFGLAAIFIYSPLAFILLKLAGAAYLLYLGWLYLFSRKHQDEDKPKITVMSTPRIFAQSILVELTNPKTALFFIAFLPQFIKEDSGSVIGQFAVLGLMYALIAFICDVSVAMLAGKLGKWLSRHPAFEMWQNRLSGGLLLTLGSYIAIDELVSRS